MRPRQRKDAIVPKIFRQYGRLTVLFASGLRRRHWICQCSCGAIKEISKYAVSYGGTTSCGCFRSENSRTINLKHGMSRTIEHCSWKRMIARCYKPGDPVYKHYGGRGITVCEEWRESFSRFLADVGPRPPNPPGRKRFYSLDRIDNNGNYEPGNVKWSTPKQQSRNTRRNRPVVIGGEVRFLMDVCIEYGVSYLMVRSRLASGYSLEEALKNYD